MTHADYLPRKAWDARPREAGPGFLDTDRVDVTIFHWPGSSSRMPTDREAVARLIKGWQDYHMDVRGWSDIAYNVAVDLAGRAWTLRGLHRQSGASGADANPHSVAVLLIYGPGQEPSQAMIDTARLVQLDIEDLYPNAGEQDGHRDHMLTSCPGDPAYRLVQDGTFRPVTNPKRKRPWLSKRVKQALNLLIEARTNTSPENQARQAWLTEVIRRMRRGPRRRA